jgi:hypothetical protein
VPTGQTVINNALTKLAINEPGGTPSVSDSTQALAELNNQWSSWGIDEGLIFSQQIVTKVLSAATTPNTIGTGASINTPAPSRVYKAYIAGTNRNELKLVDAATYFAHNDLTASAVTPDEVYVDFNVDPTTGFANVYTWPVQSGAPTLNLLVGTPFSTWTLVTNYLLPPGYQDAIEWALAFRLAPTLGAIVPPQILQTVMEEGQKAEQRLRQFNRSNRQLPAGSEQLPPLQEQAAAKGSQ